MAENGRQGLERLKARRPDAIVLDLMMPEMSGLEMLRTLRANHDDVPVLVLSARDTARQRVEGLRSGADDYLVKPFDFDEICARLEALERRAHLTSGSPSRPRTAAGEGLEGQILDGKYRLHERIGEGGFAVVHRARRLDEMNRWVAVKILRRRILDDPRNRRDEDWLRREVTSVCRVRHPGAVAVLDAGRHDGLPFLVMELLKGETLSAEISRKGRLTVERCAAVALQVCDVLRAAHDAGVVHRDVKPENVFLSRDEAGGPGQETRVKVLDFGIAKWLWADDDFDVTARQTGSLILGTLAYMAPERLTGAEIDGRYDVYGLCAVLYEALTGCLPMPSEGNLVTLLAALATTRPRAVRSLTPDVPAAVAEIVERGLSKNPSDRPSLDEIAAVLQTDLTSRRLPAATLESSRLLEARVA